MKICFICPEYPEGPHGGIGTLIQILSREFVKNGHEVRVIGIYPKNYPGPNYESDMGVRVWRLRSGKWKFGWVIPYFKQYKIIKQWAEKSEIDIVEAPDSRGWYTFWPKMHIPLILRANGSNLYFSQILNSKLSRLTSFMERKSYLRADGIISASKYTATLVREIIGPQKKIEIIYNGINLPTLSNEIVRDNNKVLFTATLIRKKGIFQFLEAIKILIHKKIEFVVDIYGKDTIDETVGSVKSYIQKMIPPGYENKIKIKDQISREDLAIVYQKGTVAVFPSFAEAFAMAPLEAMVCNCPVINTNLGSGSEFIENNIDGILIDPNDPNEISDAIERILTNRDFASMIGQNGRNKVLQNFLVDRMIHKSLAFYLQIIDNAKNLDNG